MFRGLEYELRERTVRVPILLGDQPNSDMMFMITIWAWDGSTLAIPITCY
jgi:hypothetical protein